MPKKTKKDPNKAKAKKLPGELFLTKAETELRRLTRETQHAREMLQLAQQAYDELNTTTRALATFVDLAGEDSGVEW